jgi:3-(3-hydroxy-phenyl)propionate hydroxylase
VRLTLTEADATSSGEPGLSDLSRALVTAYGTDFGVHSPRWISRFTDATRQAESYREGRVLLAGDAAHVHSPVGGQGLNSGVQDAMNLGWKLARVVHGTAPDGLLDTYHAERHPVGARVLKGTMAMVALMRSDARNDALRETIAEVVSLREPSTVLAGRFSGLDIQYDLGKGHPLLGRRMPDLDIVTDGGAIRVYELLHDAGAVLLDLGEAGGRLDAAGWDDRVRVVAAAHEGAWELPVLGEVPSPTAVLIRPDGYVAWVGDGTDAGLAEALTAWLGPRRD